MAMETDLSHLKDDMIAFTEGHGMRRFQGYVGDDIPCVMWEQDENREAWKDFVEIAKGAGATFLTMNDVVLDKDDVDLLIERLGNVDYGADEDIEEARWLKTYIGKTGFLQLGFPCHGVMLLYELSTDWYDRYQRLLDIAEEYGGMVFDEPDSEDEP